MIRLTSGTQHSHPPGRSWGQFFPFSSDADPLGTGSAGRQIYLFSLLNYDCENGTTRPSTPCPFPPKPYLLQVTDDVGSPDNPSSDANGEWVAFDAYGALNGALGPAALHRQIFIWNVVTGERVQVTNSADGDSVRPQVSWGGGVVVFESTAGLSGFRGGNGVQQVYAYYRLDRSIIPLSHGNGPSGNATLNRGGNWVAYDSTSDQLGSGNDTGVAQIYVANIDLASHRSTLFQITNGNGPSRNPFIAEKDKFVAFDSAATNFAGSLGDPGTKIFTAPVDQGQLPHVQQMTTFDPYGDCTQPAYDQSGNKIAFLCTGDPLRNGTAGNRVFVLDTVNQILNQLTGRGDVRGPVGAWMSSYFLTLATNTDLTGAGVCDYQLYFLNYLPGEWTPATQPGQLPPDTIAPPITNVIGPKTLDLVPGSATGGSQFHITTADTAVSADLIGKGSIAVKIGPINPDGEATVSIPKSKVILPPFPFPGYGALCLKATADGAGILDCNGGHFGRDFTITRDHDSDDTDGFCRYGCREGAECSTVAEPFHFHVCPKCLDGKCNGGPYEGDLCSDDTSCPPAADCVNGQIGVCNGPAITEQSTPFDAGALTLSLPISFSLTEDPGFDNVLCTGDDTYALQDILVLLRLTTGNVIPTIVDANFVPQATISTLETGAPFDCELLKTDQVATARLVGMLLEQLHFPRTYSDLILTASLEVESKPFTTGDFCNPLPCTDNSACDDGNPCNGLEACLNRTCVPGDPVRCDDGNACNGTETCDPSTGGCLPGTAPNCDDANVCTDDTCNANFGCVHTPISGPCDDGNACTSNDSCQDSVCTGTALVCSDGDACNGIESCNPLTGLCRPGIPPTCDDGNTCTDDSCDASLGCLHIPNTAPCSDNNACTLGDSCQGGICTGLLVQCSDGNACNGLETCNPATGLCLLGTPPNCDDANFCTTDSCDPSLGCVHLNNTSPCDDDDLCTTNDTCQAGVCVGLQRDCSDGNVCNGQEHCDALTGACLAGTPPNCDDGNPCTDEMCDATNGCLHVFNTAPCNDGNACTTGDTCQSGVCTGAQLTCNDGDICNGTETCDSSTGICRAGTPLACDDHDACTTDTCDPLTGCSSVPVADVSTCRLSSILQMLVDLDDQLRLAPLSYFGSTGRRDRLMHFSTAAIDAARGAMGMSGRNLRRHVRPVVGNLRSIGRLARRGATSGTMDVHFATLIRDRSLNVGNLVKALMASLGP